MTKLELDAAPPASYPVVVKEWLACGVSVKRHLFPSCSGSKPPFFAGFLARIDCQFYIGTWIIENEKQWQELLQHLQSRCISTQNCVSPVGFLEMRG